MFYPLLLTIRIIIYIKMWINGFTLVLHYILLVANALTMPVKIFIGELDEWVSQKDESWKKTDIKQIDLGYWI